MMESKKKKRSFKFASIVFIFIFFAFIGISYAQPVILSDVPDYEWWYGCSPTAAGMLIGYYDIHGYQGLRYDNLVPGGEAELSTFPSTEGEWEYNAQYAIASPEHVNDFYIKGNGESGDDALPPYHEFNCLADFMGTSQDSAGNPNGATTFYFSQDGSPLYVADIYRLDLQNSSGLYGIWEYIDYRGYGTHDPANDYTMFNQYVDTYVSGGFSFADFVSEIDSGRPVIIHLDGHSMLGYGYDTEEKLIYVHDTWDPGPHTMRWGGTYGGMELMGVTCVHLTGGSPVPIPHSIMLLGSGILLIFVRRKVL